jgi:hypothetical protein
MFLSKQTFLLTLSFMTILLKVRAGLSADLDNILLREDFNSSSHDNIRNILWSKYGEGDILDSTDTLKLINSHVSTGDRTWEDYELEFRARATSEAEDVQIFASVRYNADMSRYVIGLRGGNNNDLFLARYYQINNLSRIIKIEPLDFMLEKETWYTIKVVIIGHRISVFLGEEQTPRLAAADHVSFESLLFQF